MVNLQGSYDPNATPSAPLELLPNGMYTAIVVESDLKASKANPSNQYLAITFELVDGEHKGRKLWKNYNLRNSNAQAVAIANAEFAALRAATGVMNCHDSQQLHNIPVVLDVKVVKRKDNEELSNEIKAIHPRGGAGTVAAPVSAASEKAPWDK